MSSSPAAHPNRDVRMRGFAARVTVASAWQWLDAQLALLPTETVRLAAAGGRVLGHSLPSPVDVPGFRRAMMDGFALHAEDTAGSSPYNPLPLAVIGQSLPAAPFAGKVARGQAVRIMTGAPVPIGADAVLPAERVAVEGEKILVQGEVSPQKNVGAVGEDVTRGTTVLQQGRRLRPQDLGLLASIGAGQVEVIRQPRVRIVVTGNEILPAGSPPRDYQIGDANGPMLAALVARDGGVVVDQRVVADDPPAILQALCGEGDLVLVSGGSSVGQEDHVPTLLADHGELAVHGIAMRPSSPTGLGRLQHRLVFLLPGNPVSCLCAYDFFAGRAVRALGGRDKEWPYPRRTARLRRKLVSTIGRVDYARVTVHEDEIEPLAISGAAVLSSTTRADGFVIIPHDSEGYPEGAQVEVFLYQ